MFCSAVRSPTVTRQKPRVTAAVTLPETSRRSIDDVLRVWKNSERSSSSTPFIEVPDVERPDFWTRQPNGGLEPPRVIVPGTAITASALFENRKDDEETARVWLDAFLWQWRRQRGVHSREVIAMLGELHSSVRGAGGRGSRYHGNTQQTLPLWHLPIEGNHWEHVVASAARGKAAITRRWVIVVPRV